MIRYFQDNQTFFNDLLFFHDTYHQSIQYESQCQINTTPQQIFQQAVYCFLTPATKSDSAYDTHQKLFNNNFFLQASLSEVTVILREPPYIRFHNQKAKRLLCWQNEGFRHIENILALSDAQAKRDYIVKNVQGMGYKEATHFLRNIGQSENLVILDRHIICFMQYLGLLAQEVKLSPKNYLLWENIFIDFVFGSLWQDSIGKSTIPQADFAIWAARVKETDPKISRERILLLQ
ncbi:MAG: hypothetical protein ACRCWI_05220 [Brevinema sp.]